MALIYSVLAAFLFAAVMHSVYLCFIASSTPFSFTPRGTISPWLFLIPFILFQKCIYTADYISAWKRNIQKTFRFILLCNLNEKLRKS